MARAEPEQVMLLKKIHLVHFTEVCPPLGNLNTVFISVTSVFLTLLLQVWLSGEQR